MGSDEITLCILPKIGRNGTLCDLVISGRIQKMGTLLAGFVSVTFYKEFEKFHPLDQYVPHFDCRIFQIQDMNALRANITNRVKFILKNARMMLV